MAMFDSVTVSIGLETMGVLSAILQEPETPDPQEPYTPTPKCSTLHILNPIAYNP